MCKNKLKNMACIQRNSPLVVCRHSSIVNILTQAMHSSHNNRMENKAFKRALFVLLLNKFDRVGSIPGNEEGVLWFVSFFNSFLACRPWETEGVWNYLSPSICWIVCLFFFVFHFVCVLLFLLLSLEFSCFSFLSASLSFSFSLSFSRCLS